MGAGDGVKSGSLQDVSGRTDDMAALKLAIGNKNYSSWSMRPWLALRANDIPFVETLIPLYTDNPADKEQILGGTARVHSGWRPGMASWNSYPVRSPPSAASMYAR